MIIGDTNDFAIEAMVEPELKTPSAVWGRMCIHISDTTFGDFSAHYCALYPAYSHFKWHSQQNSRLWEDSFNDSLPEQIHDIVHNAIYGDDECTIDKVRCNSQRYGSYDFLTNWGEQFDGFASVIVSPDVHTMMIMHRPHIRHDSPRRLTDEFVIARCSRAGFITASRDFVQWFDGEAKRLSPKEA